MAIQVKTESKITGDSEHVVTEEGLKAAGLETTSDKDLQLIEELVKFQGWLQTNDAFAQGLEDAGHVDFESVARLYVLGEAL